MRECPVARPAVPADGATMPAPRGRAHRNNAHQGRNTLDLVRKFHENRKEILFRHFFDGRQALCFSQGKLYLTMRATAQRNKD
ncbi:hypothetical protein ACFSVK_14620 [Azorhizophilus paspali]|uniref:hypothetical protein n=1 Tax=Azorhizophilus paspali TaxID=69963 RepID=UPI003632581D